jgi:hypothetical protein
MGKRVNGYKNLLKNGKNIGNRCVMDIRPLLNALRIEYITSGNKHCTAGWVNTHCPFCQGDKNYHLGIPLDGKISKCWRCGKHPIYQTLSKLSKTPESQIRQLAKNYTGMKPVTKPAKVSIRRKAFKYPSGAGDLLPQHEKYLTKRFFQADSLIKTWGIMGTGPIGKLGELDYRWRIIAPIIWDSKVVSFQGRAISDKIEPKYKACPLDRELVCHKHIVYCHPECDWSKHVIVVEGITDVWRLGKQAVGVFGIEYLPQQVRSICKMKRKAKDKKLIVLFDDDPQAIIKGKELVADLNFRGMDARQEIIVGDPGAMEQQEADEMMNKFMDQKLTNQY